MLAFDILYLHTKFGDSRYSHSGDMIAGIETENESYDPDHASFSLGGMSSVGKDLIHSTRMQNVTILASAVPEISLGAQNSKWVT